MEPVPQAHGETLLTQAPAAVNEIYPNETGARGKPSAMPNRNAHARQQEQGHGTGDAIASPPPIYSTLNNAPIKPHKPRKGAGVFGIYPRHKTPHTGQDRPRKKGIKKPRPQGAGENVLSISFQNFSQQHERENQQEHNAHFLHLLTRTRNAVFLSFWYIVRRFRAYPVLMRWYQCGNS